MKRGDNESRQETKSEEFIRKGSFDHPVLPDTDFRGTRRASLSTTVLQFDLSPLLP